LLDTLIKLNLINVIYNTKTIFFSNKIILKTMEKNSKDYEFCIKIALDNAKKRINLLENSDKKSVLDEYKEWFNDGLKKNTVLIIREDPII